MYLVELKKCIKNVFCGINFCDVAILWKKCGIDFRDSNVLTFFFFFNQVYKRRCNIYANNLYYREIFFVKTFTPYSRLCGVMNFSVYWNDDYTSIAFFYLVNSKNKKLRNMEFVFAIGFKTLFCGTYSCDWFIQNCILRINFFWFRAKITKISFAIIYSATIYDYKNFWTNYLQICLNTRKIPKFQ